MPSTFLTLLLTALIMVASVDAGLLCPLCGSLSKVPTRWDYPVSAGETCRTIYIQMAYMNIFDARCSVQQEQYQSVCCDEELPPAYAPVPAPGGTGGSQGTEPECKICQNDNYPGKPEVFITARYVGTYSCGSLYNRGLNGLIPGFMCGPLQDYSYDRCGCDDGAPPSAPSSTNSQSLTKEPTPKPTSHPTPKPTNEPTLRPTHHPTNKSTPRPTIYPTSRPTREPTPLPTASQSSLPTLRPTKAPTLRPTASPTTRPTRRPTEAPTPSPTASPSFAPTPRASLPFGRKERPQGGKDDLKLANTNYRSFSGGQRGLRKRLVNVFPDES